MADIEKDLYVDLVLPRLSATSPKQLLQTLAEETSEHIMLSEFRIFEPLMNQENFRSSAVGDGIAIPHLKIKHLRNSFLALATLKSPIDFKADDGKNVDLVALLLSPEIDGPLHLRRLSRLSRILKNKSLCDKLRETTDADTIRALMTAPEGWMLAA